MGRSGLYRLRAFTRTEICAMPHRGPDGPCTTSVASSPRPTVRQRAHWSIEPPSSSPVASRSDQRDGDTPESLAPNRSGGQEMRTTLGPRKCWVRELGVGTRQDQVLPRRGIGDEGGASHHVSPYTASRAFARRAATAALCLVVALSAGCSHAHHKSAPTRSASAASSSPKPFELPGADAFALSVGFASQNPDLEAAVLASSLRQAFRATPTPLLPPGSRVTIDAASAVRVGSLARVRATVTGPRPATFELLLTLENGHWLLLATERST
jgi:hypothetical protein